MTSKRTSFSFFLRPAILTLLLLASHILQLQAQGTGYLEVVGSVLQSNKGLEGAELTVMKGNEKVDLVSTNASGKFIVNLELNNNYVIIFSKNGNISKTVEIDTKVPEESKDQIYSYKFKIDLFQKVEGVTEPESISKPVAKLGYSETVDDFDYDSNYTSARKSELEKVKQEMQAELARKKQEEELARTRARADSLAKINEDKAARAKELAEAARLKKRGRS
ncbi:MAG: hypothetical protein IPK08_14605 [Bacteroidetes bacterium]|nr:hypothetical protein [Bacteroidota bacterium]